MLFQKYSIFVETNVIADVSMSERFSSQTSLITPDTEVLRLKLSHWYDIVSYKSLLLFILNLMNIFIRTFLLTSCTRFAP